MNLSDLKRIVAEATPGPWRVRNGYCYQANTEVGGEFDDALWTAKPFYADARFISTFNPDLVAKLLKVVEDGEKLAGYIEECYPGLRVTESIRENLSALGLEP